MSDVADTRLTVLNLLSEVMEEATAQQQKVASDPPGLWQPDRHGVRAFISSLEDEVREALEAWDAEKKPSGGPDPARWTKTRAELLQVAGVSLRALIALTPGVEIDEGEDEPS